MRHGSKFIFLICANPTVPASFVEKIILAPLHLSKINSSCRCVGLFVDFGFCSLIYLSKPNYLTGILKAPDTKTKSMCK